ncbi:MAG: hypothetical protein M3384_03535 [Acidobacteriota bacterium]|nr:hypothetical protein [Acidobacteriota bacterium]
MKITKTSACILFVTFLIGHASVSSPATKQIVREKIRLEVPKALPAAVAEEPPGKPETTRENGDWKEEDDSKLKIKLLETGEGFHGDQIQAKSGETWLGLFREKDGYYLRRTKLIVRREHDEIVDGEDTSIKTGKSVAVKGGGQTVFLVKNAKMLGDGEVKTLFSDHGQEDLEQLKNGYRRDFEFNGEVYTLKVENKISREEYLGKGSKLILARRSDGKEQILNYLSEEGCNDCFWYLYWAGDLDRDGKPDFYLDLSWHYNVRDRRLFLSSPATEDGKLVKYVANFWTNGC